MRKVFSLYVNEMIKTSRKVSVLIILALMVAVVAGFGGLMKWQDNLNAKNNRVNNYNMKWQKENLDNELDNHKSKLADLEQKKAKASGTDLLNLESAIKTEQNQIDMLQYAKNKGILLYSQSYRAEAVYKLFNYKGTITQLEALPAASLSKDQQKELARAKDYAIRLENVIKNKDFKDYIAISNEEINSNTNMSADERKILTDSNDMRLKYNVTGETNGVADMSNTLNMYISQIENDKRSLLYNIDYTGSSQNFKPLTQETRSKLTDDIAVITYKLDHNYVGSNSGSNSIRDMALTSMFSVGLFMIVILMIILAGGSISQEISTGSIKSLIIAPVKRWKIFTSKVLALLTVGILGTLFAYAVVLIVNAIFFGSSNIHPYVYATNGTAHELSFMVSKLARLFADFIAVIVYAAFALMLSVITRNTAASVGISMAVYFGGSIAINVLKQFIKSAWLKFLPFNNLDFADKLFPYDSVSQMAGNAITTTTSGPTHTSLLFSAVYITILVFCMGYTAFDSFNRRDIK